MDHQVDLPGHHRGWILYKRTVRSATLGDPGTV